MKPTKKPTNPIDTLNKLSLPATILIASIILGGFFYASQLSKQKSIEKQQQIELQTKAEQDKAEKSKGILDQAGLSYCLSEAEKDYWAYMELNGTKNKEGVINALVTTWDTAKKDKQNTIDNCYKQYK